MRQAVAVLIVMAMVWGANVVEARERSIKELPNDVWDLAFAWTEPLKQVVDYSRRRDPVSGLWFGLFDGSIRTVERTTKFFLRHSDSASPTPEPGRQLRYSF